MYRVYGPDCSMIDIAMSVTTLTIVKTVDTVTFVVDTVSCLAQKPSVERLWLYPSGIALLLAFRRHYRLIFLQRRSLRSVDVSDSLSMTLLDLETKQ